MKYQTQINLLTEELNRLTEIRDDLKIKMAESNKHHNGGLDPSWIQGHLDRLDIVLQEYEEAIGHLNKTDVLDIHFARDHILNIPGEEAIRRANKMKNCIDTLRR